MIRTRLITAITISAALSVLVVPVSGPAAPTIRVGVGRADLTWHVGGGLVTAATKAAADAAGSLAGQDVPDDPFHFAGLHSRPQAKAIVVAAPQPFAFVRADILLITGDLYEAVAQRVEDTTGIPPERLALAATHTHVANNGLFPHLVHGAVYRSFNPREQVFIADQIAAAVIDASKRLRPAKLAVGSGSVKIPAENRRYTDREQRKMRPYATDPARLDPELGVIRFDDAQTGRPLAVVMNYGVHPVVLIDNPFISADFVAYAERGLERALRDPASGRAPMAIWFTGAQGDQDPIYVRYTYPEAEWTGRVFAQEAARVARSLRPQPLTRAAIAEKVIPLPPPGGQPVPSSEILGPRLPIDAPSPLLIPSSVRLQAIELSTASSKTVLLTWPGEPIRDLGVSVKRGARRLGFKHAFVLGLANDWGGYWLTPAEFERGLYERTLMFYGPTSSLYVQDHLLDLTRSLATGSKPSQVPLPPKAVADRALTLALAEAGFAAGPAIRSADLPTPEPEPMPLAQPKTITRPRAVAFRWRGGAPDAVEGWIPRVRVERLVNNVPRTVAQEGTGELLLAYASSRAGMNEWQATWEARPETPAGIYRFRVNANRATPTGLQPFSLTSTTFEVKPCRCVRPGALRTGGRSDGSTLVRVGAVYGGVLASPVPHVAGGFRLQPHRVTSGVATVQVMRRGRVIATMTLRYVSKVRAIRRTVIVDDVSGRDLPVTIAEPTDVGVFQGVWSGSSGVTFRLVRVRDRSGNSSGPRD